MRQGLFQEGVFRFKMFIPDNYPDGDCPVRVVDLRFMCHPGIVTDTEYGYALRIF